MERSQSSLKLVAFSQILLYTYLVIHVALGAHHLDLRPPNPADPADVIECRAFVLSTLKEWIADIKEERETSENVKTYLRSE